MAAAADAVSENSMAYNICLNVMYIFFWTSVSEERKFSWRKKKKACVCGEGAVASPASVYSQAVWERLYITM